MYSVGIDIGSLTVKLVALDVNGQIGASLMAPAGRSGTRVAEEMLVELPQQEIGPVAVTGYGRVTFGQADFEVSEVTCHARGALAAFPDARLVVDVGGQDSKAMRLGPGGRVLQFAMNDRCAAGTGRFLEVMAQALEVPIEKFAALAERSAQPIAISSTCTVFAESEVIGHLNAGASAEDVAAGLAEAIATRVAGLAGQVGVEPRVVMTGGVALNGAVVAALGRRLGERISVPEAPQMAGALGAALIARDRDGRISRSDNA